MNELQIEVSMLSRIFFVLSALIIAGCGSFEMKNATTTSGIDQAKVVPFCSIAEHPKPHIGKIATTHAKYSVVKHYDSFFSGIDCPEVRHIAEGSRQDADKSVANFYRAGDGLCKARKIESLCTLEADVVIVLRMRIDEDGELVADPLHVESFSYFPENNGSGKSVRDK